MAMSTMNGRERLELLKEIGGTRVYEDRRQETLKIMEDAERDAAQIADLVIPPSGIRIDPIPVSHNVR